MLAATCVRYKCTLRDRVHNGDIMSMWQKCAALAGHQTDMDVIDPVHTPTTTTSSTTTKTIFDAYHFRLRPKHHPKFLSDDRDMMAIAEAYKRFPTGDATILHYTLPWPLHWIVTEKDKEE